MCSIIITNNALSSLYFTCAHGTILFTTKLTRVQILWGRLAHASARPHSLNIAVCERNVIDTLAETETDTYMLIRSGGATIGSIDGYVFTT